MPAFRLLGPVEVSAGGRLVPLGPVKQRIVLAALLIDAGRPVQLDTLVDRVWDEAPPAGARGVLYSHLSRIRHLLAEAGAAEHPAVPGKTAQLRRQPGGYLLDVPAETVDAHRFRRLVEEAREHDDGAGQLALLRAAMRLWRGTALADLTGDWAARTRAGLEQQHQDAVLLWARAEQRQGRPELAVHTLTGLIGQQPLAEPLVAELMRSLALSGRAAEALDRYARTRQHLAGELGTEPGPQLQEVHQAVLRGELSPAAPPTGPADPGPAWMPAQLPADVSGFTGRDEHLGRLDAVLGPAGSGVEQPSAVVISAIAGTAGVGKTALAVHWAHRVRDRFPDGQLYVNLRGYAPGPPLHQISALAQFLRALGVPAELVPTETEEAAALYRSALAGRRVLVVLDNARDAGQVRSLLPGSPGCLALITSRDRLSGLVAVEGAHRLTLDVLPAGEARALLARILGPVRAAAEPDAVNRLAEACGRLPLALRIAAANLRDQPDRDVAGYAAEMESGDRLSALEVPGDSQAAVRTAFDLSYRTLPPTARQLFRRLGLAPGPDLTIAAAAVLASSRPAGRIVDRLTAAHLLIVREPGRFALHDLLRRYAIERAEDEDSGDERAAALARLLGWYLHSAVAAARLLRPGGIRLAFEPAADLPAAPFTTDAEALSWLNAERTNLLAVIEHAAGNGPRPIAWQLADALRGYFWLTRPVADWLTAAQAGLAAAEAAADLAGQASAQLSLADLSLSQSRHQQAIEHYVRAADLARQAGWREGRLAALTNLGTVYPHSGRLAEATECLTEALAIGRELSLGTGLAPQLTNLGVICFELGQLDRSAEHYRQALALHRAAGSRTDEAASLSNLGEVVLARGRPDEALGYLSQALDLQKEVGDSYGQHETLRLLAEVRRDQDCLGQARVLAEAALAGAQQAGEDRSEAESLNTLGTIHRAQGEPVQAVGCHERALLLAQRTASTAPEITALTGLAEARLALGQEDLALGQAERAAAMARQAGYRLLEGRARTALAAIHLGRGQPGLAASQARQALAIHRETGHRPGETRSASILRQALDTDLEA